MANLGSITFNRTNHYGSGWMWSGWKNGIVSAYAGYTSKDGEYHIVDEITLPTFTNAKYTAPYTLTISAKVLKGAANTQTDDGTAEIWLYDKDPTTTNITEPPAGHIGYGSVKYEDLTV